MARAEPLTKEQEADVAEPVRDLVVRLRAAGFDTIDSGDGTNDYPYGNPFPHVVIAVEPEALITETLRAREWLARRGVTTAAGDDRPAIDGVFMPDASAREHRAMITICNVTSGMLHAPEARHDYD